MNLVFTNFTAAYLAAFVLSLAAALFAWQRRTAIGGLWLSLTMFACAGWTLTLALEAAVSGLDRQLVFARFNYMGSTSATLFFLFFVIEFTERSYWLTPKVITVSLMFPVLSTLAAFTNGAHRLVWTSFSPPTAGFTVWVYHHGPLYWLIATAVLGLAAAACAVLAVYAVSARDLLRWQSIEILGAVAIPCLVFVTRALGPDNGVSLDPGAWMSVTGSILVFSMLRHHLLDVVPVARSMLLDLLPEAVLVIDSHGCVADKNPAFERYNGVDAPIGARVESVLGDWPALAPFVERPPSTADIVETVSPAGVAVSVECVPLHVTRPRTTVAPTTEGWLMVAHDITARRAAEDAVRNLNEQLQAAVAQKTASLAKALERLSETSSALLLTEDRERRRLAEELHDRVGQSLSAAHLKLSALTAHQNSPEAELEAVETLLARAIRETRAVTTEISPVVLYELGLPSALQALAEEFEHHRGLLVVLGRLDDLQLEDDAKRVLLRSAKELLANVCKHARTDCAWLSLRQSSGYALLEVKDQGTGTSDVYATAGGYGLPSVRERLGHFGGELNVNASQDGGTIATVRIPIPTPAEAINQGSVAVKGASQ